MESKKFNNASVLNFMGYVEEHGLDVSSFAWDFSTGDNYNHIAVFINEWWLGKDRELRSRLKRAFGPFVAEGEPPDVTLVGTTQLDDGAVVKVTWFGAFTCVKTGERELDLTEEELRSNVLMAAELRMKAQLKLDATTRKVITYDCKPVDHKDGPKD